MAADILLSIFFIARRDDLIINGVLRITLSVSEGMGFRRNRPLADAQGYSPPRNATNGYRLRLAALRGSPTMRLLAVPFLALLLGSGYKIVHTYPHDREAFTQGLLYYDGFLYEATGIAG